MADSIDLWAELRNSKSGRCPSEGTLENKTVLGSLARRFAAIFRTIPFENTNIEDTQTIGHLASAATCWRRISGSAPTGFTFTHRLFSWAPYGATHELVINQKENKPLPPWSYVQLADATRTVCDSVPHWLLEARKRAEKNHEAWDSEFTFEDGRPGTPPNITPVHRAKDSTSGNLESQFRHGLLNSGQLPITLPNDPFWNVRAFDTALANHNGYLSYPFLCAIHQLVMDNVGK